MGDAEGIPSDPGPSCQKPPSHPSHQMESAFSEHHILPPNESTALLSSVSRNENKPLPKLQIFLLTFTRIAEPLCFFSIFAFVNQQLFELGVPADEVGFWAGLIESLFSLVQVFVMIPWGKFSDRFGRKLPLVISLFGLSICQALFGTARTPQQMVIYRCLGGFFAGSVVTIRAMFSEVSTPATQARAFSFFATGGNLGIFLGPLLGGLLSKPERFGGVFARTKLFHDLPYFFPCLVTGAFAFIAAIICMLFLKETKAPREYGDKQEPVASTWDIVSADGVPVTLAIYLLTMSLGFGYTAVAPVAWFTPIALGGFNFSPAMISYILGLGGLAQAFFLLVVFPPLQQRIGTGAVLRVCATIWPFFFCVFPLANTFLRHDLITPFWCLIIPSTIFGAGVAMAFTAVQLAVNDVSPSPKVLGTLNGIVLSLSSAVRTFCPGLFASIFAFGVKHQVLHGYLVWIALFALAMSLRLSLGKLPKKAEGRITKGKQVDEER